MSANCQSLRHLNIGGCQSLTDNALHSLHKVCVFVCSDISVPVIVNIHSNHFSFSFRFSFYVITVIFQL